MVQVNLGTVVRYHGGKHHGAILWYNVPPQKTMVPDFTMVLCTTHCTMVICTAPKNHGTFTMVTPWYFLRRVRFVHCNSAISVSTCILFTQTYVTVSRRAQSSDDKRSIPAGEYFCHIRLLGFLTQCATCNFDLTYTYNLNVVDISPTRRLENFIQ